MFTPVDRLSRVNVGGGRYKGVLEYDSPLGLDGIFVGHACMSIVCVSLTLHSMCLLLLHDVDDGCSDVVM